MTRRELNTFIREKPLAQHAIGAAAFGLLTGALYVTTILPMQLREHAVEKLHAQIADQQARQERLQRSRQLAERQLEQSKVELTQTPIEFASPRAINEQLARLAELAGWSGLTVETIDPGKLTSGPMLATQPIRVTGRGSFNACHTFMRVLREETPETSVNTFSLSADGTDAGELRFEMNLLWYSRPEVPTASASVDTK
jgi:hypothetical protein